MAALFDSDYQYGLLRSLFTSKHAGEILEILHPDAFDPDLSPVVREFKTLFLKHGKLPAVRQAIQILHKQGLDTDWLKASTDEAWAYEFDLDQVKEFILHRTLRESFLTGLELLEYGKYDEALSRVVKAQSVKEDNSRVVDLFKPTSKLPHRAGHVPLGIYSLDMALGGGLAQEELGLIMGPSNCGKTSLSCAIGAYAVSTGRKVLHLTTEQNEHSVCRKYFSGISGKDLSSLASTPKFLKTTLKRIGALGAECRIIRLIPDECDCHDVMATILNCPFKPDLVLLDTPDDLRSHRYNERRFELGYIYRTLHGIIDKITIPMWVTSQSNRESYKSRLVQLQHTSEDISKIQKSDCVITVNPCIGSGNQALILYLAKNREGIKDLEIPVSANWPTCSFTEAMGSMANTAAEM